VPIVPISTLTVSTTKTIKASDDYLKSKHNLLPAFESAEHFFTDESISDSDRRPIEHHMLRLRAAIARVLWSNEIYIGRSLLDDFVLHATKLGKGNVCNQVLTQLAGSGAEQPGFVLYPLTSFGLATGGPLAFFGTRHPRAIFKSAGFGVLAQSHSVESAYHGMTAMARALGIRQKVEWSDIEHYAHSAKWLDKNPLLMVRLVSHTGDMYENQFVYTLKIRIAAATILMIHALSVDVGGPFERFGSTAHVNKFETLDIRHYLVAEGRADARRSLSLRRVPMNVAPLDLARLSDIAVTISADELATERRRRFQKTVVSALNIVERGYFRHVSLGTKSKAENRLYRRLITALDWYRQSFGSRTNQSEAIVALAVALETLLTDHYQEGVSTRIQRRVGICMKGVPGVNAYKQSVLEIYYARSEIVHTGELGQQTNLVRAQAAFARCFCNIASRLVGWVPTSNDPMRDLLKDF